MKFFKQAADLGSLNAEKEVIILKYIILNKSRYADYNPTQDIIKRLEKYTDGPRKVDSYSQIAFYYLSKNNLVEAIQAMVQVMNSDLDLSSSTVTVCIVSPTQK